MYLITYEKEGKKRGYYLARASSYQALRHVQNERARTGIEHTFIYKDLDPKGLESLGSGYVRDADGSLGKVDFYTLA